MDGDVYLEVSVVLVVRNTLSGRTAASMHEQFRCLWEVKVDNIVKQRDIKTTCCQIGDD